MAISRKIPTLLAALGLSLGSALAQDYPLATELSHEGWTGSKVAPQLANYRGKVVMLNFFMLVCPWCEVAHPKVQAMRDRFQDQGFEVIGVASAFHHKETSTPDAIRAYVKKHQLKYPVVFDKNQDETFNAYGAEGTPFVVFIDRQGRARAEGFFNEEGAVQAAQALLAESP